MGVVREIITSRVSVANIKIKMGLHPVLIDATIIYCHLSFAFAFAFAATVFDPFYFYTYIYLPYTVEIKIAVSGGQCLFF